VNSLRLWTFLEAGGRREFEFARAQPPAGQGEKHILIDVGNALGGKNDGGLDTVFEPVINNILEVLDGEPLDLYVMTHEHMDHVQGLLYASAKREEELNEILKEELKVRYAWLTASAAPDYYDNFPDAEKEKKKEKKTFDEIGRYLEASRTLAVANKENAWFRALMHNNNSKTTADYVDSLRTLAPEEKTFYVHRETDLLETRCEVESTEPLQNGDFVDIEFEG